MKLNEHERESLSKLFRASENEIEIGLCLFAHWLERFGSVLLLPLEINSCCYHQSDFF